MDAGPLGGTEDDDQEVAGSRMDRGAPRVGGRGAEGPLVIGQQEPAGQVHPLLANPRIALALTPHAHTYGASYQIAVVETQGELAIQRAKVADIDHGSHLRKALALEHASQQRLAARTSLGGIDVETVEQRASLGDTGNVCGLLPRIETLELRNETIALLLEIRGKILIADSLGFEQTERQRSAQGLVEDQLRSSGPRLHRHAIRPLPRHHKGHTTMADRP